MDYFKLSLIFIAKGFILIYLYFLVFIPTFSFTAGFDIIVIGLCSLTLLMGIIDVIYGIVMLFLHKIDYEKTQIIGFCSIFIGLIYLLLYWWYFWYVIMILITLGIFVSYIGTKGKKPSD